MVAVWANLCLHDPPPASRLAANAGNKKHSVAQGHTKFLGRNAESRRLHKHTHIPHNKWRVGEREANYLKPYSAFRHIDEGREGLHDIVSGQTVQFNILFHSHHPL